jgi:hypothetical protein
VSKVSEFICDRPIKEGHCKKYSELGRHLTTNYCESQYITLNGKFKVNKNAQVASALLFGTEKNEPYLQRHFRNFFNAV